MSENVINSLSILQKFINDSIYQIEYKDKIIQELTLKNNSMEDELVNFKKVSFVASLSRQLDAKNNEIDMLNKKLNKKNNTVSSTNDLSSTNNLLSTNDSDDNTLLETNKTSNLDEIIEYDNIKYFKDVETKKIYNIVNGERGIYVGKETKKGKLKIKT